MVLTRRGIMQVNFVEYYIKKIQNIDILEANNYNDLDLESKEFKKQLAFYRQQKDDIGKKIRMLEVYQCLWEDLDSQLNGQALLNEEFWNNMAFNMIKYQEFIRGLDEEDYNQKIKNEIDKKVDGEIWEKRQQMINTIKNDINYLSSHFNKMHRETHQRALNQRICIEKHILFMATRQKELEETKESYRSAFYDIQRDIGTKGSKLSRQALSFYRQRLLGKIKSKQNQEDSLQSELLALPTTTCL